MVAQNPTNTKPQSKIKQSTILKAAAVIVASPRSMGAFGVAVGADIHASFPWLITAEVWSGLAMAILEGAAVSYTFTKWRQMQKGSLDWWVLTFLLSALLLLLPLIASPYLIAMQDGASINEIMPLSARWIWAMLVTGLPVLIIAAVGYADIEQEKSIVLAEEVQEIKPEQAKPKPVPQIAKPPAVVQDRVKPEPIKKTSKATEAGKLQREERKVKALKLHEAGYTPKEITTEIGVKDVRTVKGYLNGALQKDGK